MRIRRLISLLVVGAFGVAVAVAAPASGDSSGLTVPTKPGTSVTQTWTGTIPQGQQVLLVGDPLGACDIDNGAGARHAVQIKVPSNLDPSLDVTAIFSIDWDAPNGGVIDNKLIVLGPENGQPDQYVADSDTGGQSYESATVTLVEPGTYTVIACPFENPTPTDYTGSVTLMTQKRKGVRPGKGPAPTYAQFTAPKGSAADAGEPSIGNVWATDTTLFQSYVTTYRVGFNDAARTSTWQDVSPPLNVISLDPILFTDSAAGRTFVSQLLLACSSAFASDDLSQDAPTWTPSEGCGEGTGVDHQSIGGGPWPASVPTPPAGYPHAVYYCTNGAAAALCASSHDGGVTFGPAIPAITDQCGVLHGHIRVAPNDGTVYLPSSNCQGKQGMSVSTDGGLTWTVRTVPDSIAGTSDPSVAVGSDGTVYFGYADGTGKAKIAISRDRGLTWTPSVDAGFPFGISSTEFAEVIAGDGDRAAFAFLGTPTEGDYQSASFGKSADGLNYSGANWHLYVATTYDRGGTWTTVDATPTDPVQRGCFWNRGGSNTCRNLLDFNDITVDRQGRVMIAIADGCSTYSSTVASSTCAASALVADNKHEQQGAIVRQLSGRGLFAHPPAG